MENNSRPQGRARGRSRGQPRTTEEANAAFLQQQPGGVPPRATGAVAAGQVAATGRGRGASADRDPVARGRGVSQEREGGPAVSGGRAYHRGRDLLFTEMADIYRNGWHLPKWPAFTEMATVYL